jgi:Spy/CpxP family protein refolding chaperone
MTESDRFEEQMRAAREAMHRYRHALRALATGETIDEAREAMAREEREGARPTG